MGLDMYMYARHKTITQPVQMMDGTTPERPLLIRLAYWRKHPDLHSYIEQAVWPNSEGFEQYGPDDYFNQVQVVLDESTLLAIRDMSAGTGGTGMPKSEGGFFFSESRPEDNQHTVDAMNIGLAVLEENNHYVSMDEQTCEWEIVYDSWW